MKKWHVILAAALAMGTMTALTGCGSTEVDLNQYVSLECEGYDSAGTATYTIDWEGLVDDNRKAFDLDEDASKKSVKRVVRKLEDEISGELDETENLSNGDTVTFQWDKIDTDKLEERYPVKLSYSDVKLEVKGLDEPEDFNPFDYLTVSYEGEAPHGYVYLETDSDIPYYVSFEADQSDNLSNGDKIKVTVASYMDEDLEEECLASGLKLTETEKTYTVEGLESYVQKRGMTPGTKAGILGSVTAIMALGAFFMVRRGILWPCGILAVVWVCHVVYFLFGVKTLKREEAGQEADEAISA